MKIKTTMIAMVIITMIMIIQKAVPGNKLIIPIHKQTRSQ